jgi:hypothetical protein
LNGNLAYTIAGYFVYVLVAATTLYTMFLLCLSRVALSILLALGPLFFAMLLFEQTRRFFEAWTAQLANYAFITVLTVLIVSLMLQLVTTAAAQASAAGAAIQISRYLRRRRVRSGTRDWLSDWSGCMARWSSRASWTRARSRAGSRRISRRCGGISRRTDRRGCFSVWALGSIVGNRSRWGVCSS